MKSRKTAPTQTVFRQTVFTRMVPTTNVIHTNGIKTNGTHTNGVHINSISCAEEYEHKLLMLPVSAASTSSLQKLVQRISDKVLQCDDKDTLQSIAYTLFQGRDHLRYRSFVLTSYDKASG